MLFAQSNGFPYGHFPDGIELDASNLIYPSLTGPGPDAYNSSMILQAGNGGIFLHSGITESSHGQADGGITLMGSPISMVLGSFSLNNSDASSFDIWKYSTWSNSSSQPLFSVDGLTGNTTFTDSNVAINNGSLTLSGSPVLTQASAVSALSQAFLPANPLSIRGNGATLSNGGLIALGQQAESSAEGAVAIGVDSYAIGAKSISIGQDNYATNEGSMTIGHWSGAYGAYSVAMGCGSYTWDDATYGVAIAGGEVSKLYGVAIAGGHALGQFSFALGGASAEADSSIALGGLDVETGSSANCSTNDNATTIGGMGNRADGFSSFATGFWTKASSYGSVALGSLNLGEGSAPNNWVESDPLFEVGNGFAPRSAQEPSAASRSNAITTRKNGQTTLTNKAWKANPNLEPTAENSYGQALVVEGHTVLNGKVTIAVPQGDISMGIYGN